MADKGDRQVSEPLGCDTAGSDERSKTSLLSKAWKPQVLDLFRNVYILFFTCVTVEQLLLM